MYLVGAGPGDPRLLTRRGAELLARADAVVYDGLVHRELLALAPGAQLIYVGKKRAVDGAAHSQEAIHRLLVELAREGKRVVRLKGGDPFVFGRGAQECRALASAGIRFEVVPGVSAALAVSAYAGIPLTARDRASTVTLATGREAGGKPASQIDWAALAKSGTVVLFMALATVEECCAQLISGGKDPDTPAAAIYWGTTASQVTCTATLATLPSRVADEGLVPPVLIIVGKVVELRGPLAWYEARPLFGARVLITRDSARAAAMSAELQELGGDVLVAPMTSIEEPADPEPLRRAVNGLDRYDWVVFASKSAVDRFWRALWLGGGDARRLAGLRLAAVGEATAQALTDRGVRADCIPPRGDAEGLAAAVAKALGDEGRILLPRAAGGRPTLAKALRAAGATVDEVEAYRTAPLPGDAPAVVRAVSALKTGGVQVAVFFAPSQVHALVDHLGARAAERISAVSLVACIGPTTERALRSAGVRVDVVAKDPVPRELAQQIAAAYAASRRSG